MDYVQPELFPIVEYGVPAFLKGLRFVFVNMSKDKRTLREVHTINILCIEAELRMRIVAKGKTEYRPPDNFRFVTVTVSGEDVAKIDEAYGTPEAVFDFLQEAIAEGLKVSFASNEKNGMVVCSLYDRRKDSPSSGACLTGGAATWYDALRVVAYKYTVILHGDLSEDGNVTGLTAGIW